MYKKFLLSVLLIFFISTLGISKLSMIAFADSTAAADIEPPPPRVAHHVIGNWNNQMDSTGCVLLDDNYYLNIQAIITVGDNNLSEYPPMYVFTQFNGAPSVTYGPIQSSDLEPLELYSGQIVYTYTVEAYYDEFSVYCRQSGHIPLPFEYEISSVNVKGDLYPIDDYPDLLVPSGPANPEANVQNITYNTYAGTKNLCCPGSLSEVEPEGFVQDTGNDIEINNIATIHSADIFPNPFSESLTIKMQGALAEVTMIQLWDVNGRLVYSEKYIPEHTGYQETRINTNNLKAGLYYCTLKSDRQSETFKVLKLN